MRRVIIRFLTLAVILVGGSVVGNAQLTQTYRAQVPFDFTVDGHAMKAGEYQIRPVLGLSGNGYLVLIDRDHGKSRALGVIGQPDISWSGTSENRMVFINDSGGYALTSIETRTFRKSIGSVTATAQVIAKNEAKPKEIWVALK